MNTRKVAPKTNAANFKQPKIYFNGPEQPSSQNLGMEESMTCRICLGNAKTQNQLITPCLCINNKYVHQLCELQFIARAIQRKPQDIHNIKCENCKELIRFRYQSIKRCSCQMFFKNVEQNGCPRLTWVILFLMIALGLMLFGVSVSMSPDNQQSIFYIPNLTGTYVTLAFSVLVFLLLVGLLVVYLNQNFVYLELYLYKVLGTFEGRSEESQHSSAQENQVYQRFVVVTKQQRDQIAR